MLIFKGGHCSPLLFSKVIIMDKSLKKKRIIGCIVFYVIMGALFIYGTIGMNDLNFDKMVFNPQNKFAFTMACYGMLPHYTMQLLCFTTLMAVYRPFDSALDVAQSLLPFFKWLRENKVTKAILLVLYRVMFVAFIYGAYMGSNDFWNFILYNAIGVNIQDLLVEAGAPKALAVIAWAGLRIVTIILCYFVLKKLCKNYARELEFMAVAGLAMFYSGDIINVLKEHFHRIRFREMVAYSNGYVYEDNSIPNLHSYIFTRDMIDKTDFHWFTHWYQIGQDDGVIWHDPRSFPSGHTSAASFSLLLIPLSTRCRKLSKLFVPAYIIGVGYTMAMGLSRMMRGAHYMTDVTGAAIIMFTLMIFFVGIFDLLQKRSDKRLPIHKN